MLNCLLGPLLEERLFMGASQSIFRDLACLSQVLEALIEVRLKRDDYRSGCFESSGNKPRLRCGEKKEQNASEDRMRVILQGGVTHYSRDQSNNESYRQFH